MHSIYTKTLAKSMAASGKSTMERIKRENDNFFCFFHRFIIYIVDCVDSLTEVTPFVFLAQGIGDKGEKFMKKNKVKYTNKSVGKIKIVDDFLPQPKDLVLKEETAKITISLTKSSIKLFKNEAEE